VVVVMGATAAGKSAFAMRLTDGFPSEIISFDSMKVYRGMDIGTDKPSPDEQRRYHYHLLNVKEPTEISNAGWYITEADRAVADILAQGHLPIIEGGTALYLKAFLQGIFEGPGRDGAFREELLRRETENGEGTLHKQLAAIDPASAAKLHPRDLKRIVRALEVHHVTGRPMSEQQQEWVSDDAREGFHFILIGIRRDRKELYRRIDRRVDEMMEEGFLDEVRGLWEAKRLGPTAGEALGYRELVDYLEGRVSLEESIRLIKRNTRHFARRQIGWFSKFPGVMWYDVDKEDIAEVVQHACGHIRDEVAMKAPAWKALVAGK
jgi:tRNA dimethylallyltransferase